MTMFRYPSSRPGLALIAALLLAGGVQAQSVTGRTPVTSAEVRELDGTLAAPAPAPAPSLLAACTAGQTVTQAFVTGATFAAPVGNTAGTGGTPQEFGQSYTAPCDGLQTAFAFVGQTSVASQVVAGTLTLYAGAGTAGTLVAATAFSFTLPTVGGYNLTLTLDPFTVVQGQVYTAFVDLNASASAFSMQFVQPGTYPDGVLYFSTSGGPSGAILSTGDDLIFTSTFNVATTVTTPTVFNGAGYRLLSPPVSGISIADLAAQNLVQGISAGNPASFYLAQYPGAASAPGPNLFTVYGGTAFFPPATTGVIPLSGRGFFWYWYDQAITPNPTGSGGGTSTSRELTGFTLTATGVAPTANVTRQVLTSSNGTYMLGNPFAAPFQLSGLTNTLPAGSTLGTVFSVFDPATASYVTLGPADFVAPWQGFFAQVTGTTNPASPTFVYAIASTNAAATPPFYGRSAVADTGVRFRLDGNTAAGETHDLAAQVRFLSDAAAGQDRHDGAKLLPPGDVYALLAPVAGDERLSVNSLPEGLAGATVPLALRATNAGTFTLTWEAALDGRTATLRDLVTGATVDLATATEYAFASDATDWATRFELVLGRGAVAGESGPTAVRVGTFAPNPAAGASRLTFTADAAQTVRATVVDALGREVVVLFEGAVAAGAETALSVEAGRLAPGTYAVRIAGETFAETRRLTVVR